MAEPASSEEYLARFHANQRTSGFGITGTTVHMPCPFCAAADWLVTPVIDTEENMQRDTTCSECGRSSLAIVRRSHHGVEFEFVQTGGADPPEWLTPKMRRVDKTDL